MTFLVYSHWLLGIGVVWKWTVVKVLIRDVLHNNLEWYWLVFRSDWWGMILLKLVIRGVKRSSWHWFIVFRCSTDAIFVPNRKSELAIFRLEDSAILGCLEIDFVAIGSHLLILPNSNQWLLLITVLSCKIRWHHSKSYRWYYCMVQSCIILFLFFSATSSDTRFSDYCLITLCSAQGAEEIAAPL